ncbi:transposase [Cystobacter fuscus]|uniref:Transposase n=1 Tax=Cystobacter fuscus TaxID=43 RepID=A0A250IXJ3_9BACT|nr:IS1182 family transposase [Cystobacter fuscus]ATB36132.1 transposase [Cystobacter fuscus]ATB36465.1 transposase [Cystobacter fuscus]ATB37245.1 transposase [Cystobacter fuscus]ATB40028.1 transposase [Cystobacter fuscus]ATB41752.1 transposase [Cystobacter fuscus]
MTLAVSPPKVTGEIARWTPPRELNEQEQQIVERMSRNGKLFAFLRLNRHKLMDEAFQAELASMYRQTGAGKVAIAPGLMAMAILLQGYMGVSDATLVELTVFDLRVQMVLGWLGHSEPAFSQGSLYEFRQRLMRNQMDRRLLEKTVEVAREQKEFGERKLKTLLRVAIDSKPLEGAGRVEDTINLVGHAARKVMMCVAKLLGCSKQQACREAGIPLLLEKSIKKGLDVDWSEAGQKKKALQALLEQVESMMSWLRKNLAEEMEEEPLREHVQTLEQIRKQDLEPDPEGGGVRVRQQVAEERRVSVEDGEMRHGRKSKSKRFNGFKQHVATALDEELILACAVTPANRPEAEATPALEKDMEKQGVKIDELHIDRGYINSSIVDSVLEEGGEVLSKPWKARNGELFAKSDFKIDMRSRTITCPEGKTMRFELGKTVEFATKDCETCPLREKCTQAQIGQGRTVAISEDEALQHKLRKLMKTPAGRERLRKRVGVEHRQAHIARRQGRRARYRGVRKNVFDLRRAASIQNLETWQRHLELSQQQVG